MSDSTLSFEKEPEFRRRSRWGRIRQRPWWVVLAIVILLLGATAATYAYLRLTRQLPGQVMARESAVAMQELVATPEFEQFVVAPLRQYLTSRLAVGARPEQLAETIRRSTDFAVPTNPRYQRPQSDPTALVAGWRDIIDALRARGLLVYGYPLQLQDRERWLRSYIISRVLTIDKLTRDAATARVAAARRGPIVVARGLAPISSETFAKQASESTERIERLRRAVFSGTDPMLFARNTAAIDIAERAVIHRFEVSPQELYAMLLLAENAERMQPARNPKQ